MSMDPDPTTPEPPPTALEPPPATRPTDVEGTRGGWRTWIGRLYVLALVVAAVGVLVLQHDRIADLVRDARPLPLVAALALGLVSLAQSAFLWTRGLTGLGFRRPMGGVLEATVASVPARYVPGSIWYSAGRITHLRRSGTPGVPLAIVAVLETLLSFLVAVSLGLAAFVVAGTSATGVRVVLLVGVAVAMAVAASPWVLNPAVRWVARRRGIADVPSLRWAVEAELCAHLVAFWITSAGAFVLYLSAFPGVDAPDVVRTAGGFLLGWAAGFIAVFAPQGAGVFETAVAGTLHGAPLAALALVVGGYRAVTAVRDVLALLALAVLRTRRGRRPSTTST